MSAATAPLTIVGTVHFDPAGEERLFALLSELRPETVTVEVSPYALEFRRTAGPELLSRLEPFRRPDGTLPAGLQAVAAQLEIPFEYRAAELYAEQSGAQVVTVGDSRFSRRLLYRLERELMVTDNLVLLATREEEPLPAQVAREWQRAERLVTTGAPLDSHAAARLVELDRRLVREIRRYLGAGALVHVSGWEHIKGLCGLLSRYRPEWRLLVNPSSAVRA